MAPKFLFFLIFAFAPNFSTCAAAKRDGGAKPPVIHFISVAAPNSQAARISVAVKAGAALQAAFDLIPKKEYQLIADINDVYIAIAGTIDSRFVTIRAFVPGRDQGNANIYWRANDEGFSLSYDKTNWVLLAPWKSV